MPKVFLSYRRADPLPNWQVKRIAQMCAECGFDEVFVDRDTGAIPPGSNYRAEIEKAVGASEVVLVLIGEKWQSLLDQKREDPNDMVRLEIHLGMSQGKKVVPILLGGAMPGLEDLPEHLREFHYCNGQSFEPDTMDSLLPLLLKGLVGESVASPQFPTSVSDPVPVPNPLQDFAARAEQRAEEEVQQQRRLEERREQWTEQFKQFQDLRKNPHLSFDEIREALHTLCRHWEMEFPEDWDGSADLISGWEGNRPVVKGAMKLPCEKVVDLGPGVQMTFCFIPAGSFKRKKNLVTLSKSFWMAKYPVTQGQWTAMMGSNPSNFKNVGEYAPVEQVSWKDTQAFLKKAGQGLRLATEAEWEYACRAGTTGAYNVEGASLDELGWYNENSAKTTHSVGQKKSNAWGLSDCHGNVWEWCQDWYGDYPNGSASDPRGPGQAGSRVLRGGSWLDVAGDCRSAFRDGRNPDYRGGIIGFRPVV